MKRVLLIDDDSELLDVYRSALEGAGYAVSSFSDPLRALTVLEDMPFALAITDLTMPRIDGVAFINYARMLRPELRFMVLTSHLDQAHNPMLKSTHGFVWKGEGLQKFIKQVHAVLAVESALVG